MKPPDLDIAHKLSDRKRWHSICRWWCVCVCILWSAVCLHSHSILNGFMERVFFSSLLHSRSFFDSAKRTSSNWIEKLLNLKFRKFHSFKTSSSFSHSISTIIAQQYIFLCRKKQVVVWMKSHKIKKDWHVSKNGKWREREHTHLHSHTTHQNRIANKKM